MRGATWWWDRTLALPLPVLDQLGDAADLLHVLAGHLVALLPVVVAADAAVLPLGRRRRHHLHEVAVVRHPHLEERVQVVRRSPAEHPARRDDVDYEEVFHR